MGSVTLFREGGLPLLKFQLTRSVGSVTNATQIILNLQDISTHTLRGERDITDSEKRAIIRNFNSHAPWGA